jgi:DUF4097 and DUF4098 domain-containing protein YvlB
MFTKKSYQFVFIVLAGLSFFMFVGVNSSRAFQSNRQKPYRVKKFSIKSPGQLKVRTAGGAIKVVGSQSSGVQVEMYVTRNGKNLSPADTKLKQFDIRIAKSGNKITAVAKRKKRSSWKFWKHHNISISFVVYTPQEMSTDLKTSGGHIIASGLTGKQHIRTSGGYLKLHHLKGTIHARTSGGHIDIENIAGELHARTSGGRITAKNTSGLLNVHTSGGSIQLADIAGTVKASTSGGSIDAQFAEVSHSIQLHTSGGNIHITVPKNIGLNLDLHGSSVRTQLRNFSGEVKHRKVEGTINGGGPKLTAETSGGNVHISYEK